MNGRALVETVHEAPAFVAGAFLVPGAVPAYLRASTTAASGVATRKLKLCSR
ncbi:hypothetical protein RCH16_001758 [Cryobacterium sp. MP_M5]|nr:hypothetical protein [Cryobacterium sp. MP_M3]MEC5176750.1 hypothetical protein [Cryobacterium sp. MP_M5]